MGNKVSIEILIDHDGPPGEVTAGQQVQGTVFLNVRRPIRGGKVRLMLHGKEQTTITTGVNDTLQSERKLIAIHQTLKEIAPAHKNNKIPKGEYCLPFQFVLPTQTPPSQEFPPRKTGRRRPRNGFRVHYELQASLGQAQKTMELQVHAAPLSLDGIFPFLVHPLSFPISTLNVIQQGEVVVGARVEATAVGRGENIQLRLACRNDSAIDIRRVAVKLLEHIEWKVQARDVTRRATRTLVDLRDVDLPSLARDKKDRSQVRRSLSKIDVVPEQREATYQAIYDDLTGTTQDVLIVVPEDSRDSYQGQLVKVHHSLSIKLQTRSMSTNASISIPIRLGAPRSNPVGGNRPVPRPARVETTGAPPTRNGPINTEIPVAQAIPEDTTNQNILDDDVQSVIVLSGDAVLPVDSSLVDLEPIPVPFSAAVSISNLLERMDASLDCYSLISSLLLEIQWVRFLCSMSSLDFGRIISRTTPEEDQPRVANLLCEYINGEVGLTCAWAAAAVRATSPNFRATTAKVLLPHCKDLPCNHGLVREELNAWERTVTEEDFKAALRSV